MRNVTWPMRPSRYNTIQNVELGETKTYAYDVVDRLTSEDPAGAANYSYDAVGNRLSPDPESTYNY